jgi:predicted permease
MRLAEDVRFAFRVFRKNPGFTAVAVLTLALGIGGNTALFMLVDQLILRELPVRDPARLVSLMWSTPRFKDQSGFSDRDFEAFQRATPVLTELSRVRLYERIAVEQGGAAQMASGEYVSGNYFGMLGVRPALGRLIEPADDKASAGSVVVLSFGCWQRRFGGDPGVLGRVIRIESKPATIIGVTPESFYGLSPGYAPEFRLPLSLRPAALNERERQLGAASMLVARLGDGVSREQGEAALQPLFAAREQEKAQHVPDSARESFLARKAVLELKEANHGLYGLNEAYAQPLWIVFAITSVVLLVACVNIAGLLLAQADRRQHETAVRVALGASRGQILSQFLVESLLLAVLGTVAGVAFAWWASNLIVSFVPAGGFGRLIPVEIGSNLTLRTLGFLAGMCVLTAVLFGLMPGARAARSGVAPMLKGTAPTGGRGWSLRNFLLASQVALSLALVLGATTLVGTLGKLLADDPGYKKDQVLLVSVDPMKGRYKQDQAHEFFDALLPRVEAMPGVQSASLARYNPLGPMFAVAAMALSVDGRAEKADPDHPSAWAIRNVVAPRYFQTLGIPLLSGRDFTSQDGPQAPKVAIVNERFARHYFGTSNPIGRRIGWNGKADREIIGVVGNAKYTNLREGAKPYWFIPYAQAEPGRWQQMTVQARVTGNLALVNAAIRKEIAALDPTLPIFQVSTLETEVDYHLSRERLTAVLGGFFGVLAALLAGIGTYGVVAQSVARRMREIGIRLALGAERGQIVRLVLSDVLRVVAIGLVVGLPSIWLWRKLLSSFVYGVTPTDPVVAVLAIAIVGGVALLATYGPVRRAAGVNPMITLRYE